MRLTGSQIAAALALARVSREVLASEAGVGRNTVDRILNEETAYREETIHKIRHILEIRGIEFLPGEGVRKKEQTVTTYSGDDCLRELLLDVYKTLQGGGELLIAHLDEGDARKSLEEDFLKDQIQKRKDANIKTRMLVQADDANLVSPYDNYRAIPAESFSPYPFYIYGSKLALLSWKPQPRVIIIDDQRWAESATKLFDIAWKTGSVIMRGERTQGESK